MNGSGRSSGLGASANKAFRGYGQQRVLDRSAISPQVNGVHHGQGAAYPEEEADKAADDRGK